MKEIIILFILAILLSCNKEELVNDNSDVYGLYTTEANDQHINFLNFSQPYLHIKDTSGIEVKYNDYTITDSKVFTEDNVFIYEIISYTKNKRLEILEVKSDSTFYFDR